MKSSKYELGDIVIKPSINANGTIYEERYIVYGFSKNGGIKLKKEKSNADKQIFQRFRE